VVMAVVGLQLLDGHTEPASGPHRPASGTSPLCGAGNAGPHHHRALHPPEFLPRPT
jgi:hypothetical protein